MKPYIANLICSSTLILFGAWAYFNMAAETRSMTVLIPVFFGLALIVFTPLLKKESKVAAHIVVGLTVLITLALIVPLMGSIGRQDPLAIFRVGAMLAGSLLALFVFIKSFIEMRRMRQAS